MKIWHLDYVVNKVSSTLTAKDISFTYDNPNNLIIALKDMNGKALVNQYIAISLNKKVYNKKTDGKGQVKLPVNLPANKYAAKITFAGDGIYKSSSCTSKIVVNKATPKLTASSKTFKAKAKTKKVTITLKNKNNPIKNVIVKLTVNKKTYNAKTNSKGDATFNLKLTKKGKYNAVYKFAGNSNLKSSTKSVKITIT